MVKFRVKDDWASYKLPRNNNDPSSPLRVFSFVYMDGELSVVAQWQTWLRHGREDSPSIQELIADETRRHRTRELAARIDDQWRQLSSQGGAETTPIGNTDEALKGTISEKTVTNCSIECDGNWTCRGIEESPWQGSRGEIRT